MTTRIFTAGILMRHGKLLTLKRKSTDDTYPGLWDCPGGHFERGESAEECVLRETREEVGVDAAIVRPGRLIEYRDGYGRSIAVPFLLESSSGDVVLSEHSAYRWVEQAGLARLRCVPALKYALEALDLTAS